MKKSESSQQGGRAKQKKSRIVSYSQENLPKPSAQEIKRFLSVREEDIDTSDIPELDAAFWKNAKLVMPESKKAISIRLDADVYEWFRKQGPGYQSRINAVLKSYMGAHKGK